MIKVLKIETCESCGFFDKEELICLNENSNFLDLAKNINNEGLVDIPEECPLPDFKLCECEVK